VPAGLFNGVGHRKGFSSLGATTLYDRLPVFGLHPLAETMGSFSTNSTGLVSTFHAVATPLVCYGPNILDEWQRILLSIFSDFCQERKGFAGPEAFPEEQAKGQK
jgi:hypothetical protein